MRIKLTDKEEADIHSMLAELDTVDQGLPVMEQMGADVTYMQALSASIRQGFNALLETFGSGTASQSQSQPVVPTND